MWTHLYFLFKVRLTKIFILYFYIYIYLYVIGGMADCHVLFYLKH